MTICFEVNKKQEIEASLSGFKTFVTPRIEVFLTMIGDR